MNRFIPILFFLFFGTKTWAQHQEILGSHISYHAIDLLTYEAKLTIVRDCSGDLPSLNDTLSLRSGSLIIKQKTTLVSVEDITPVNQFCNNKSYCSGGTSDFGIEERVYKDTFYLDSVKDCDVYFEWTGNKRYSKITTGSANENHYNYAYLNYCLANLNTSFFYQNHPKMLITVGHDFGMEISSADTVDKADTMINKMVNALKNVGAVNSYTSPYTYEKFLTYLGAYKDLQILKRPAGISLDPSDAELYFRPMKKDERTVFCMESSEYREINGKKEKIGTIRWDMVFIVDSLQYGEAIPDSNFFAMEHEPLSCNEIKWKIKTKKTYPENYSVTWTDVSTNRTFTNKNFLQIKHVRNGWNKMILNIKADFGCAVTYMDSVFLDSIPEFKLLYMSNDSVCKGNEQQFKIDSVNARKPFLIQWENNDHSIQSIVKLDESQYYHVKLTDREGCSLEDSLPVTILTPVIKKSDDLSICSGDSAFLTAEILNADNIWKNILWNENDPGPLRFIPTKDTLFFIKAIIGNYCTLYDSVKISISKLPEFELEDSLFCAGTDAVLTVSIKEANKVKSIFWNGKTAANGFLIPQHELPKNMSVKVLDLWGCSVERSYSISAFKASKIELAIPDSVCFNDDVVRLKAIPGGGVWKGALVKDSLFYPLNATNENNQISYFYTDTNKCTDSVTRNLFVKFVSEPEIYVSPEKSEAPAHIYFEENSNNNFDTYFWEITHPNYQFLSTQSSDSILTDKVGTYDVKLMVTQNGCSNVKLIKNAFEVTRKNAGIAFDPKISVLVHPNPANDFIFITSEKDILLRSAKIYSLDGRILFTEKENLRSIGLKNLKPGVYILMVETNQGIINRKIIVN